MTDQGSPPLRIGVLTVSDKGSRGERVDESGKFLADWCGREGHLLVLKGMVPDQTDAIVPLLLQWADGGEVDVIFTTGGTGFGPRDVTPEATRAVVERPAYGLSEGIRRAGEKATPYALLSRGLVGARGEVLVVNLPGSTGGVRDALQVLGPMLHHVSSLLKDQATSHRQS